MRIHSLLKQSSGISGQRLYVSEGKQTSFHVMPPMFKCPAAPEGVPVAGVGGIDLTGGELQDLLGGPAPGVWVGLDMKQLRGEAEVGVLRGRGNVDLELGWGGGVSLHLPGSLQLGPLPAPPSPHTQSSGPGAPPPPGQGSVSPTMLSGGSIFQELWREVTLNSCCCPASFISSAHIPRLTHYLSCVFCFSSLAPTGRSTPEVGALFIMATRRWHSRCGFE